MQRVVRVGGAFCHAWSIYERNDGRFYGDDTIAPDRYRPLACTP